MARFSENASPTLSPWQGHNLMAKEQLGCLFEGCFRCKRHDSPESHRSERDLSLTANLAALAALPQVSSSPRRITMSHSSGVTGCTERRLPR
jgi:hypothetical protein